MKELIEYVARSLVQTPDAVRVEVREGSPGEVVKLSNERKRLTDAFKIVAYQAESDLVRLVTPHYRRVEDEGRTLVRAALTSAIDLELSEAESRGRGSSLPPVGRAAASMLF